MSLPGEEDKDVRTPAYGASPLESPAPGRSSDPKPRTDPSYCECLKNHAASRGGNITDGCGEFMPGGEEGTLEALKCAACGCHRSFHRKEQAHGGDPTAQHHHHHHIHSHLQHHHRAPGPWGSVIQPLKVAFGAGGTDSSSEELNFNPYQPGAVAPPPPQFGSGRKRFRTKFTGEQKERMLELAERLGWRIPREDDAEVQRFCAEVGVKRQVFKVWMHNNKTLSSSRRNSQPLI